MKIKKLVLRGFKSFADRTEVELHEGITAIVGPNGCGKSNISDAIRWVLGEQAPSAIRGSRMEEAIFGGTEERRPISRAEVNLVLNNESRTLPIARDEVEIGRTVYRGGESDYRLNGDVVRLKDIQDLRRDTGLGATEYAVIEGRMIDAILSDSAEERRALFEEAAEIGRYKDRRRTALRRLDQAEEDLERLEDVLGEVQTKVRSLAQQRGRAERYRKHRERRRRLEVAVAAARLEALDRKVKAAEEELRELEEKQPGEEGVLQERETRAETLRVEIAERERERSRLAEELEEVRDRLGERERRRLVASERATSAERRIEAIQGELESMEERRGALEREASELEEVAAERREAVAELEDREETLAAEVEELDARRRETREGEEDAEARLTELEREVRLLEAEREVGGERLTEREEELERRREELAEARRAAAEHERSVESEGREADRAGSRCEDLRERLSEARTVVEERREALRGLREGAAELEGDLSADRARVQSLSGLLASGDELPGAVARLLDRSDGLEGVHGVLADSLEAPPEVAGAVEATLGAYLHGVVVDDWSVVRQLRRWLDEQEEGEGLLLLPLDPGPRRAGDGSGELLRRVEVSGAGAPWARALLSGVELRDPEVLEPAGGAWARPDGSGQDAAGAVRVGRPGAARGALERRTELRDLRARVRAREEELEELRARVEEAEEELDSAEERTSRLESALASAETTAREAEARREAAVERRDRARTAVEELEERVERLRASLEEAEERVEGGSERLAEVRRLRDEAEEALDGVREEAREAHAVWEERRAELHELQLRLARRESELSGDEERLRRVRANLGEMEARRERLEQEREEERRALAEADETADRSEEELEELFERRNELREAVRELEEELGERRSTLEELESWLRDARRAEREHAERRHELELELAELRGQRGNVRERIEGEWDEPLEELVERVEPPEEGGLDDWSRELEEVRGKLARLGPVNLLAEEEYEEQKERLDFLEEQRQDLRDARDDLLESIQRINRSAAESFEETFDEIRENFRLTFRTLFEGGECDLWLEDESDPLDSAIEISASPRGKRTQRIHLLSGGERALTALSLLFAIYLAKPSPFCIMDEVDAPLDENNILRFVGMLERFKDETQFIVITHNPRTIEAADWIYGVTMQEPGVSSVVGVELDDLPAEEVRPEELARMAGGEA